jgi:hypothetical protein
MHSILPILFLFDAYTTYNTASLLCQMTSGIMRSQLSDRQMDGPRELSIYRHMAAAEINGSKTGINEQIYKNGGFIVCCTESRRL